MIDIQEWIYNVVNGRFKGDSDWDYEMISERYFNGSISNPHTSNLYICKRYLSTSSYEISKEN